MPELVVIKRATTDAVHLRFSRAVTRLDDAMSLLDTAEDRLQLARLLVDHLGVRIATIRLAQRPPRGTGASA